MHYLWFAVELSGLLGLGTTALWESFRLRKYFADAVGGGVGSDTYMFLIGVPYWQYPCCTGSSKGTS